MSQFLTFAHALKNDEDGATMIEYTLLAGLITVAVIALIGTVSGQLVTLWTAITNALGTAVPAAPPA